MMTIAHISVTMNIHHLPYIFFASVFFSLKMNSNSFHVIYELMEWKVLMIR